MRRLALGLGALLLVSAPVLALQEKTYQPKLVFKLNERNTYAMKMNMNMVTSLENGGASPIPNMEMVMDIVTQMKTVAAKMDGSGVVALKTVSGKVTVLGMEQTIPDSPAQTIDVDARGRMKMRALPGAGAGPAAAIQKMFDPNQFSFMGAILPENPVKVGDTWDVEIELPSMTKKAKVSSTLLGIEEIGGQPTLKIKQVMTMPFDMAMGMDGMPVKPGAKAMMTMKGDMKVNGVINIVEASAKLLKSIGDVSGVIDMIFSPEIAAQSPFGAKMSMKMDAKMSMDLTKSDIASSEAPKKP